MNDIRLLIVDDEPLIRLGIRSILATMDGVTVLGECGRGADAIEAINSRAIDLVLLDVLLPDCTGMEVVSNVGPERMPMVIFVTAYDEYAVRAFELNAVDYVLKPFDAERLRAGVERARRRLTAGESTALARQLRALLELSDDDRPARIVVRQSGRYDFVAVHDIDRIEAASNFVQLYCATRTFLVSDTMKRMESKLNPQHFMRIHRQHIVNMQRVVAIHPIINGCFELELRSGVRIASGRQYKESIQRFIQS
jgi:two-component system LytT family response regulator